MIMAAHICSSVGWHTDSREQQKGVAHREQKTAE